MKRKRKKIDRCDYINEHEYRKKRIKNKMREEK